MKIRTDLPVEMLEANARLVGVTFSRLTLTNSRTHSYTADVVLSGNGKRKNCEREQGATWDEWGKFLALLFHHDPRAVTTYYRNSAHFAWSTGSRYGAPSPSIVHGDECPDHKWEYMGGAATNAYMVFECAKGCGALKRYGTPAYVRENF